MSDHLAIATVTATLRQLLHDAVTQDVSGAAVEVLPLNDNRLRDNQPVLNLFLFHVAPSPAWRNQNLPTRRTDGSVAQRPQLALNLSYLMTAFGRSTQNDPEAHRLLGSAVRVLHERPVLARADIRAVVQAHTALAGSNLADQVELVRLTPQSLSLEELSKLWSVFFQTPYRISLAYEASVVLIEGRVRPSPALPVRSRNLRLFTLRAPWIERAESADGPLEPLLAGGTMVLRGANLRGEVTVVRFGEIEIEPEAETLADDRLQIVLPEALTAGVRGVHVVHRLRMGDPDETRPAAESNVAAFVLRPRVLRNAADTDWEISVAVTDGAGSQPRAGQVTVRLAPAVGRAQRVTLLLNEIEPPSDRRPRAYAFDAPSRAQAPEETTDTIVFEFSGVLAGTYLVRLQVDGAESPLQENGDGTFAEPRATVP
jgi:hypothetical protein